MRVTQPVEELVLEAGRTERHYWRDLWRYRELLYILAWRDIAVRYKQTAVGVAWALLQPLAQMLVMVVVFSKVAGLPSDGQAPYALMVFAAMLPWQFFASAISSSSASIVGNANLISKVYFPRMLIPAAAVVTSVVDFLISFAILVALMLWYGYAPGWRMLTLPLFMALALLAAFGPGLLVTALNTEYRDFRYVIPFIVQFGLYVSPVGFSSTVLRERFGEAFFLLYSLNPMVGVIEGFRWAILDGQAPLHAPALTLSILLSLAFLLLGALYFRRLERSFADVI
ncbi:MAG: ABC transporter permease [Burkholderiales bacterium]|nr:ABC transporter permease [Burkholderiales bacterium]